MSIHPIQHYIALGDSLSEGYSDWGRADRSIGFAAVLARLLREQMHDLEFSNFGLSGARVSDVLRGQVDRAVALTPDLLTVVVGANDISGTALEQFRQDYGDLVARLRSRTSAVVVVATIPDVVHLVPQQYSSFRPALVSRIREFNRAIADTVAAHGVLLVDLASSREVEDPRNLSGDGLHPNARGYLAMARIFVETLNGAGFDLRMPELDP